VPLFLLTRNFKNHRLEIKALALYLSIGFLIDMITWYFYATKNNTALYGIHHAYDLFEAMFLSGNILSPSHCFGILLWFGAIHVEGAVAGSSEALQSLTQADAVQRRAESTRLDLGPEPGSPGELAFFTFAKAMYLSWVLDAPLYVSA